MGQGPEIDRGYESFEYGVHLMMQIHIGTPSTPVNNFGLYDELKNVITAIQTTDQDTPPRRLKC